MTNYQLTRTVNSVPEVFAGATFEEIKKNLIDWLRGQEEFQDYDFTGSRINVLVDLLAYNTLYMQQFSNAAIYESFIRTANLRSSVVQAAQDMGYFPSSKSAAGTSILLTCSHKLNEAFIRIPRGTKFLATAKEGPTEPYSFVVMEDVVAVKDKDNKYLPIVKLAQGRIVRTELLYNNKLPILIRDVHIDRQQVRLFVDGSEWTNWTNKSMVHAGSTSNIFYMRETIDGHTEFFFGEGESTPSVAGGVLESNYVGGLRPTNNSTVVIEYLRTDGEKANGSKDFTYADTLQYITVEKITENFNNDKDYVGADGGGDPEDIERIRELAPVKREAQMRCVTASDYESFVSARFGSIVQAIQCFTDKDKYGYAFIAIKPKTGLRLTSVQREDIQNYLADFNVAPITPSVISPNYLFLKHRIKVTYALNKLTESEQWLESKVIDQIDRYYTDEVEVFNKSFHKSRMLSYVDDADHSVLGSTADIAMVREVDNFYSTPEAGIKYYNQITPRSIESNEFEFTPTTGAPYNVRLVSSDPNDRKVGKIIIGPFRPGDVKLNAHIQPYTGNDFNKMSNTGNRTQYFVVGEVRHNEDYIYWNLGAIDVSSELFQVQSIDLTATPTEANIFTRDGSLIVFENDLRPQYTTIIMEPIAQ